MPYNNSKLLHGPWPPDGIDAVVRGLPRHLAIFMAQLAVLTAPGRTIALTTIGPGSRLVLEALRMLEVDGNTLTSLGDRAVEVLGDLLADAGPGEGTRRRRLAPIAKVEPQSPQSLAAFQGTVPPPTRETYNLFEDTPGQPSLGAPAAAVRVILSGSELLMWQASGQPDVVLVETDTALPRLDAGAPMVVAIAEDEPPALALRERLGLTVDD